MKRSIAKVTAFVFLAFWGGACSSPSDNGGSGGASLGGAPGHGGASSGGTQSGGAAQSGGSSAQSGGAQSAGGSSNAGASASGGTQANGGRSSGGSSGDAGARSSGGSSNGGASTSGGASASGGSSGAGGKRGSGGSGSASGGAPGAGGGSGGTSTTCALPSTFKWTSGGPIAQPKNGWVSLKDFTNVVSDGKHIIYMSTHDQSAYGAAMMTFTDWPDAASAAQNKLSFNAVAPTLFYFTPKKTWVLAYQWGKTKFSYRTSSDPTNANGWGAEQSLYNTALPSSGTGPIDQTVICNATKCYLYYAGDNGHVYKSSMAIGSFPSEFPAAQDSGIQGTSQTLFEAVQIYTIKGANKYLMIVEAQGSARYFRAWTATDLDGPWTLLTDNFAIKSNVTFSSSWTNDISHGDLVRENPDETFTVDPCNLQMVFQGRDPNSTASYDLLPYRPGLLTLVH